MKAQVTVFIIFGILIVAVFFFVSSLVSKTQGTKLSEQQKKAAFQPEKLQVYTDECIGNKIDEGIKLLAAQGGHLWADQPGGVLEFNDARGVEWTDPTSGESVRVAYAIDYNADAENPNKYPCTSGEPPAFCEYSYPDTSARFGETASLPSVFKIENALTMYLKGEIQGCITDFINTNVTISDVEIGFDAADARVKFFSDGVDIKADYSLKITPKGKKPITYKQTLSYFHKQPYKPFFEAVATVLDYETRFVEFDLVKDSKKEEFTYFSKNEEAGCVPQEGIFACTLKLPQPVFSVQESGNIIKFISSGENNIVIDGQPLVLQAARRNRPPALDYISRYPLKDVYDFLVILGDESDEKLGEIKHAYRAKDPDGTPKDEFCFEEASYEADGITYAALPKLPACVSITEEKDMPSIKPPDQTGFYALKVKASDGQNEDWQVVRILVDHALKTELTAFHPYGSDGVPTETQEGKYIFSKEDPFFIKATVPQPSVAKDKGITAKATVKVGQKETSFTTLSYCVETATEAAGEGCSDITKDQIKEPAAAAPTAELAYEVKYSEEYSRFAELQTIAAKDIQEVPCIPLAEHQCCTTTNPQEPSTLQDPNTWEYASPDKVCSQKTEEGCFGNKAKLPGYLLEHKVTEVQCGNKEGKTVRGNACLGEETTTYEFVKKKAQVGGNEEERNTCGSAEFSQCDTGKIEGDCAGQPEWTVNSEGWCWTSVGDMGCSAICGKSIVDNGDKFLGRSGDTCGCTAKDEGNVCWDINGKDGKHLGKCTSKLGFLNSCEIGAISESEAAAHTPPATFTQ